MRRVFHFFRCAVVFAILAAMLHSRAVWSEEYTVQEAGQHVGETATVCGVVVSPKFAAKWKGQSTFLNLDRPYPNHLFTVVIWGVDRPKFDQRPEVAFAGMRICAYGLIVPYKERPEIIVHDPGQITTN